jgi:DNA-binding NarL/FixJ family response regulator
MSSVVGKRSSVLVAGIEQGSFEALTPVLDRQGLEIVQVAEPEMSIELAEAQPFDLLIFDSIVEMGTLAQLVDAIRDESSASRNSSLLVLAKPATVDMARNLVDRGVNRVMLLDDPPELIGQQVAELLDIAPRADLRYSTRLKAAVGGEAVEVLGQVANLSISGMLIETETSFERGEEIAVTINLGGRLGSVVARAEVVRQAHSEREGVCGIGVRFLGFARDGAEKIAAVVDEALAESPVN